MVPYRPGVAYSQVVPRSNWSGTENILGQLSIPYESKHYANICIHSTTKVISILFAYC